MQVLNGNEREVLNMLKEFGLCQNEAKMYFTLLTIGESKVRIAMRKASVPEGKAYDVLRRLREKGFVQLNRTEGPKMYRAKVLDETANITIKAKPWVNITVRNAYGEPGAPVVMFGPGNQASSAGRSTTGNTSISTATRIGTTKP